MIVDRVNNLDTLEVQVEVREGFYSDEVSEMNALSKKLASAIKSVLSISAKVKLVEPGSIERAQGKSQHVIDKRVLK
jgi:phenylacetate-CoA ligase